MSAPRRFFTSDQHIGHVLVSGIRGFESTDDHDAALAEAWDAVVRPKDIVYVLGDISINPRRDGAFSWFSRRPGTKHLVMGNHDLVHPRFGSRALREQRQPEWRDVFATMNTFVKTSVNGVDVLMSHYPYRGEGVQRIKDADPEFRLKDEGLPLLHGHIHTKMAMNTHLVGPRQLHVGVDAWNWTPVSEAEVATWISMLR